MPKVWQSTIVPIDEVVDPQLSAFIEYWESKRGDAFAPTWKAFNLVGLPPSAIPNVVVVDVIREPLDFVVRFWGTGHVTRKGTDKTGQSINEPPAVRPGVAHEEYCWVVKNKKILASRDTVDLKEINDRMPFQQGLIRAPLSDDGDRVTHIISLAIWDKM